MFQPPIPTIIATLVRVEAKLRRASDPEDRKFFHALRQSAIDDLQEQKARLLRSRPYTKNYVAR